MHAEIIAIGSELLNGATLNTNATFISQKLHEAGFSIARHTAIGDEHDLITETLSESLASVPLVIVTGGLGPTLDDITKVAAAELFDSPLELNLELATELKNRYQGANVDIESQATVPKKAMILPNPNGTAPGLVFYNGHSTLILLPGVPGEMQPLMTNEVIPFLKRTFTLNGKTPDETLHFFYLSESQVNPILIEIQTEFPELKIGIYPKGGTLSIRMEGDPQAIQTATEKLQDYFGDHQFFSSDGRLETAIQALFLEKKWTLSVAESCTGGTLASKLTRIPGASAYFVGGVVAYANELKEILLKVPEEVISSDGAVSEACALAMAEGVQLLTKSTFSIGTTGIAGPTGGSVEKPVGTVYIAIKQEGKKGQSFQFQARGTRDMIIEKSVNYALGKLYQLLFKNLG